MRAPTLPELTAYVCAIQPELDRAAAERVLLLDEDLQASVARSWREQRAFAESLLELHLGLEGTPTT